jgi:hypothetical protein
LSRRIQLASPDDLCVSAVAVGELRYGAEKSAFPPVRSPRRMFHGIQRVAEERFDGVNNQNALQRAGKRALLSTRARSLFRRGGSRHRCRAQGLSVYEGRAVAHGRNIPFLPILEVFHACYGITPEDDDR